jgi:uncharacterized delta-60 repeat protein
MKRRLISALITLAFAGVQHASAQSYDWSTYSGQAGSPGSTNGTGTAARFEGPHGISIDAAGNMYVAERIANTIRKITPAGVVTTLAGQYGVRGSANGTGTAAQFDRPNSTAVDAAGNVYVADTANNAIRKITPAGVVTTLAGQPGTSGSADGTGSAARFNYPDCVAVDTAGNVYVGDLNNHTIRKITPAGVVSTLAGLAGSAAVTDGTGSAARFNGPTGIALDASGNLFVADYYAHTLRKVTPAGVVTTLAGLAGSTGSSDGTGSSARFWYPQDITLDAAGNLHVTDSFNHTLRRVTPAGVVTTTGGLPGISGTSAGIGLQARFAGPTSIASGPDGYLYVTEYTNHRISRGMDRAPLFVDKGVVGWGAQSFDSRTSPPPYKAVAAGAYHTVALKGDGTVVAWGWNGDGQTNVPTGLSGVTAIEAGGSHTVALKGDGTVVAWGWNGSGQTSVPGGLSGVTAIAAGQSHTVALKGDGTVVAWGWNGSGQTSVPGGLSGVTAIAAGGSHTVALKGDGTVVAWGSNGDGQTSVPGGLSSVTAIAAGNYHTVALKGDGTVVAWGWNDSGQTSVPGGLSGVTAIAAGYAHTVALKGDGTVVAWGSNGNGQTSVPGGLSGVTAIAAGKYHTVALKGDGTVVAWGWNDYGQTSVPTGLSGVTAIAAGQYHTVALKGDGTVVAWGWNGSGQTSVPSGLSGVAAIAAGDYHTVALKGDGTVVAWGWNGDGQTSVPGGLSGVTAIAAGQYHTVALKGDGTVVAWGNNGTGQTSVPTGLSGVTAIAAGDYHTVALKVDGTVVAWGSNGDGQTSVPGGLSSVTAIGGGNYHTVALKGDGTVVAWGWNGFGQTSVPTGLSGVTAIAAGQSHTVAVIPLPPQVVLGSATAITTSSATLSGSIQSYGKITSAGFETAVGSSAFTAIGYVPISLNPANGTTAQSFSVPVTGLQPGTTYSYRITAASTNGTTTTGWLTFTTANNAEISVRAGGIEIPSGDTSPQTSDLRDLGNVGSSGLFTEATYTITNAGPDALMLTDTPRVRLTGANAADFTVISQPAASVAAGQSTSFTVRFHPLSTGLKTATVSLMNSDPDESPYTFAIQGSCGTGVMDARFSMDGVQSSVFTTSGTPRNTQGRDTVVQPDGKIVVVGFGHNGTSNDTVLARFLPDGTPDASFGTNGQVRTDFGGDDACYSVALQADGKIVVGGEANLDGFYDFALARYHPDGSLDTSFGGDGMVTTNWFVGSDDVRTVLIQPDGKIIAAGTAGTPTVFTFAVARYLADGTLDSTFGTGGKVNTAIGAMGARAYAAVLQPDGKIILGGHSMFAGGGSFALARYTSSGALDTSFGSGGIITTVLASGDDWIFDLALQTDGKIVAGGRSVTGGTSYDFGVARYLPNGTLDVSFDGDGMRTVGFGFGTDSAEAVEVQPDGKIVLSGFYSEASRQGMSILRLNNNGGYDQSYGPDGIVKITPGPTNDRLYGSALDANGNFVGAGFTTDSGGTSNMAVVRVLAASAPGVPLVSASVAPAGAGLLVSGQVQPAGASTTLTVDYGTTNALGNTATIGTFNGGGTQGFETTLYPGSLGFGVTYYYRVTAVSVNGTTVSAIQSFTTPSGPGIRISGNGQTITPGDSAPSVEDRTDFGSGTVVNGPQTSRSFTISNIGTSTLNLNGLPPVNITGANASDFTVTGSPAASVAVSGSTTLNITFNPSGPGLRSAQVTIASNALHIPSYTFAIQGTGTLQPAGPGQLDPAFGTNGVVSLSIPGYLSAVAHAVTEQSDGKLLVAGEVRNGASPAGLLLARLNVNGTLDTTFDGNGWLVNPDGIRARAVALQADGKIVVFGLGGLFRYLPNGTPDTNFGNDPFFPGRSNFAEMGSGFTLFDEADMVIQPDGEIVAYGLVSQSGFFLRPGIRRFNSAGSVDTGFNGGSVLHLNLAADVDVYPTKLALQHDGKIIAIAGRVGGGDSRPFVVRVTAAGALDSSFGSSGVFQTNLLQGSNSTTVRLDTRVQPDGRIVIAGRTSYGSTRLLRLLSAGTLDPSFGFPSDPGISQDGLPLSVESHVAMALQPDGKPLTGVTGSGGPDIILHRHNTGGLLDSGSFGSGWLTESTSENDEIRDLITDAGGNAVLVGTTGAGQALVARVLTQSAFPPAVSLLSATQGGSGAVLQGTVNPRGKTTTAAFEYSLFETQFSAPHGQSVPVTLSPPDRSTSQNVTATISGPQGGATYYYRLTATNADGTSYSTTGAFQTAATNADLGHLSLSSGTLSPSFASGIMTYSATVPNSITSVTLTATLADPAATFTVNGASGTSSSPSAPISLTVGSNPITVNVTAADGVTTKTYNISVTRLTTQQDAFEAAFSAWAGTNSVPANVSNDPDGDGKTNLEEFAFGTHPGSNTSGTGMLAFTGTFANASLTQTGQPSARYEPSATSGVDNRATFIRRADHASLGLTYTVQFSANLTTWSNSTVTPTVLASSGDYQLVSVKYPLFVGGRPARFFRVTVNQP